MSDSFHYPPELTNLLVDTIPLLCRSKRDVILFFRGAGVTTEVLGDLVQTVATQKETITKFEIVRTVLERVNFRGDATLRERREILKRVVEFEEFSSCWDEDRLKAQGLVAETQKLVNIKDAFARMSDERESERRQVRLQKEAKLADVQSRSQILDAIKRDLYALFAETDAHSRGKKLEGVLNRLFAYSGILVRDDFTLRGTAGEGVLEQIDGVIEMKGHLYFVEVKWWAVPVGVPEISHHLVRVFTRAETRALIISASEYTQPAITLCKEALSQKAVTLCTLREFVLVLEKQCDLTEFLCKKVNATLIDKNPFPVIEI